MPRAYFSSCGCAALRAALLCLPAFLTRAHPDAPPRNTPHRPSTLTLTLPCFVLFLCLEPSRCLFCAPPMALHVLLALLALCSGQALTPPVSWRQFGYDASHAGRPPYLAPFSQLSTLWTASPFSLGERDFSPVLSSETRSFILPASDGIFSLSSQTGVTQGSSTNYTFSATANRALSPALSSDGATVYYVGRVAGDAAASRRIFAAHARNLTTLWYTAALSAGSFCSHITMGAGDVLFVGVSDGTVRSFFPNGSQSTTYDTGVAAAISTAPSLSSNLARLFVASGGTVKAFAVNSSGSRVSAAAWSLSIAATFSFGVVAVSHDDSTLYLTDAAFLYAINATSGALIARSAPGSNSVAASAAGPACLPCVYVTSHVSRALAALNASTTLQHWSAGTPEQCNGAPFVSFNGIVVWVNNEGIARAANASSGAILWSRSVGGGFTRTSPILGPDGTLYAAAGGGTVVALRGATCRAQAGSYCPPCSSAIAACEPGFYSSESNGTVCAPCPAGNFSSAAGAASCPACPPGTYGPAAGLAQCTACAAGSHSPSVGSSSASVCATCAAGTFSAAGAASCSQCPGGHYCPAGASSWARLNCGRGNYCPRGSGAPTPCPHQVPPSGGWGALQVQGPALLVETASCLNHCFWNFTSGDGMLSKC